MVVIPAWLDQAPTVDFTREKNLLTQLETWAEEHGWIVSDGSSLPDGLRQRTDILFERPERDQRIRLAILQRSRRGVGGIRLDASSFRTVELTYLKKQKSWRVEAAAVPIDDDLLNRGWDWLINLLFRP